MKWINWLYVVFLGIILSITVGFGLAAFYPQPIPPSYYSRANSIVSESCNKTPENQNTPECKASFEAQRAAMEQQDREQRQYQNESAGYTRTAVFFGIVFGALFAVAGVWLIKASRIVANGLLLGAVGTAIFTRMFISLASLGASVSGTNRPDAIAYMEFFALVILSGIVVFTGTSRLKETLPPTT